MSVDMEQCGMVGVKYTRTRLPATWMSSAETTRSCSRDTGCSGSVTAEEVWGGVLALGLGWTATWKGKQEVGATPRSPLATAIPFHDQTQLLTKHLIRINLLASLFVLRALVVTADTLVVEVSQLGLRGGVLAVGVGPERVVPAAC
jgi:hypothetical protein